MKSFAIPLACALAAACSTPANPPSLLPRAIESRPEANLTVPQPLATKPISAPMALQIAKLVAEAKSGDADFAKANQSGGATVMAGRSAPLGSEAWVAAELVRSALQVARQRSAAALAEIDSLAVMQGELSSRDPNAGGLTEIQAAQTEIEAIVARQTARLAALSR
jgi:hypothetical protein